MEVKEKKNNKKVIILIIILLLLIIVGIIIFLLRKPFVEEKEKLIVKLKDGESITEIVVDDNGKIKMPAAEKKEGYILLYYLVDGEIFYENSIITENIEIEAIYIPNAKETVQVIFNLNEGTGITSTNAIKGGNIVLPSTPTKSGYIFVEWHDKKGKVVHNGDRITNDNTELTAIWKINDKISSTDTHTCDNNKGTCTINGENCNCEITKNAIVSSFTCLTGEYDQEQNLCIKKETINPSCKKGTYSEKDNGCKVTTNKIRTCASGGTLIDGKCYFGQMKDFDVSIMACNGYMPAFSWKCFSTEKDTILTCPSGYKSDSDGKCYKIEKATYCKTGFTLSTEGTSKTCVNKTIPAVVYSCKEGYTLDNALCTKTYTIEAKIVNK